MSTSEVLALYRGGRTDFTDLEIDDPNSGETPLRGAVLSGADFSRSFIVADFTSAELQGASFRESNVKTCAFDLANLTGADFRGAAICAATFKGALVSECTLVGAFFQGFALSAADVPKFLR